MNDMTSATSGESGARVPPRSASLDGEISFTTAGGPAPRRRPSGWWALGGAALAVVGIVVWSIGDGSEPDALVTATDVTSPTTTLAAPTTTSPTMTSPTTTSNVATATSIVEPDRDRVVDVDSATSSTAPRPIVPASTSTSTPPSTEPSVSSTIVVARDAGPAAPQVSLVDDAITGAVVVDPVPNTALDGADRSPATTAPAQTAAPLVCNGPVVRLDTTALLEPDRSVAEALDGAQASIVVSQFGIGVAGGRDDERIDYSAERGGSERIIVDLGAPRCAIGLELAELAPAEWQGTAESAHWVGLDGENRTVAEGWLLGTGESVFVLELPAPVDRLLIEGAPYGATAAGWPEGADREVSDNSDFVVTAVIVR